MDTAVWVAGDKEKLSSGKYSIARQSIAILRAVGLLGNIIQKRRFIFYPAAAAMNLFRGFD